MNNYWIIDGVNEEFKTLEDAKYHIYVAYTPKEISKYLKDAFINHIIKGEWISYVRITIKNGKVHYSRVKRI